MLICTPGVGRINYQRHLLSKKKKISLTGAKQLTFSSDSALLSIKLSSRAQILKGFQGRFCIVQQGRARQQCSRQMPACRLQSSYLRTVFILFHFLQVTFLSSFFLLQTYGKKKLRQNCIFLLLSSRENSKSQIFRLLSKPQIKGVILPYMHFYLN